MRDIVRCGTCGKEDFADMNRLDKHSPCNPEPDTVWISFGRGGERVDNTAEAIAGKAMDLFALYPKISSVSVHHGRCNLGLTTPDPCNCYPITHLRPA